MAEKLNADEAEFLRRLRDAQRLAPADRAEDKARQWCRRQGFAKVVMKPRRWVLTENGRAALALSKKDETNG